MVHYLKEIPISETVIKDLTYSQLFWQSKCDFLDQRILFNCFNVSSVIICIHISSYFGFQYNNWQNKAGISEYLRTSPGRG